MEQDFELARGVDMGYSVVRALADFLDDLSAEGLQLWITDEGTWFWQWGELYAAYPLWAMGEAVLDAVAARFPETFDGQAPRGCFSVMQRTRPGHVVDRMVRPL